MALGNTVSALDSNQCKPSSISVGLDDGLEQSSESFDEKDTGYDSPPSPFEGPIEDPLDPHIRPLARPFPWFVFDAIMDKVSLRRRYRPLHSRIEDTGNFRTDSAPMRIRGEQGSWPWCTKSLAAVLAVIAMVFFGLIGISVRWQPKEEPFMPDWGKPGHLGEGLAHYPTDLTRDVLPIPCHSHNDYWRRVPLFEALHYGMTSVEADIWLFDNELFVGHDTASLTANRTFRSLYVDPIYDILEKQNPSTRFSNTSSNGVFDEDPSQTLVLLVDFKTDGPEALPYVQQQLSALDRKSVV